MTQSLQSTSLPTNKKKSIMWWLSFNILILIMLKLKIWYIQIVANIKVKSQFKKKRIIDMRKRKKKSYNTYNSLIITAGSTCAGSCMRLKDAIFNQTLQSSSPITDASLPVFTASSACSGFKLVGCVPQAITSFDTFPPST